jgi:hypothetical protein
MKIPAINAYDDLDRVEKQEPRTPASDIRHISVDGTWFELDLTADHASEFDRAVLRYVNAGVKMDGPPKKKARAAKPAPKNNGHGGRRPSDYYEGLIAWTDANSITKRDGSGRPAYAGVREGRNDYPDWLIRDYDAYLETAEPGA